LKLVLSVDALAPNLTGIGRYAWELVNNLPHHAHIEDVKFYRNGRWVEEPATLLQPVVTNLKPGVAKRKPFISIKQPRWLRDWRTSATMSAACRGRVFHGPNFFLPACAEVGVATVHDLSVFKFPETHPLARIRQFESEFKASMARAAHVVTDSETTRLEVIDFLAWPADKVTAVPLGVSSQFAPAPAAELAYSLGKYGLRFNSYALCVSTIEPRKKIANLLQAYLCLPRSLQAQYPLVLAGGFGWLSETLHQEIDSLAARGVLRYLGFVPESDLPALYGGAAVFVYPSTYEGFGLPPIEAMACGVPVVVSNQSCLPEVTQGAALTVNPDDIPAFKVVLEKSLTDALWRASAKVAGLKVAASYTWQRCVDETVGVYQFALQGGNPHRT